MLCKKCSRPVYFRFCVITFVLYEYGNDDLKAQNLLRTVVCAGMENIVFKCVADTYLEVLNCTFQSLL